MSRSLILLLLSLAIPLIFHCTKLATLNHGLSHLFTFLGFCCLTVQQSARNHEDVWSGTWSAAPSAREQPWSREALASSQSSCSRRMGPQASTPLPHLSTAKCLSSSLWSQRMCSLSHMPKLHLVWTQFSTLSLSFSPEKSHLNPLHFLLSQSKLLFLSLKCAPFPGPRPPPSPFVSTITNLVY